MRSLLGDVGSSLRGRPRPRFTKGIPLCCCCCLRGDAEACLFTGEYDLSRVLARDELEATTTISSSSSCRGIWVLGIVKGAKKSVMLLDFFDMATRHQYVREGCVFELVSEGSMLPIDEDAPRGRESVMENAGSNLKQASSMRDSAIRRQDGTTSLST